MAAQAPDSTPPTTEDQKASIRAGYDQVATKYRNWVAPRNVPARTAYVDKLLSVLSPGAKILELGCGPGVPCTQLFVEKAFSVTGVDVSASQIELAKEVAATATFIHADMMTLSFPEGTFDAITAFYSIFHLPRSEQPKMIDKCLEWLKPGGYFLCNLGTEEGDVLREGWFEEGVRMWSFNLGVEGNKELFRGVKGLEVLEDGVQGEKVGRVEVDFYWVFGRKAEGGEKGKEERLESIGEI
ncbi:MAG: hypothetical protein MMC33_004658 [Icmadophila ericetorum]|nr:hypothetical protein [Icmadophila ericetorum]